MQHPQLYLTSPDFLGKEIKPSINRVLFHPLEQNYQAKLIEEQQQYQYSTINSHKYFYSAPETKEEVANRICSDAHETGCV